MIHTILTMGSMLGLGALLTHKVRFNKDTRGLFTSLIIYIGVPSLVLVSFLKTPYEEGLYLQLLWTFLFSIGIYLVIVCCTKWLALLIGISNQRASELAVISAQGNTGYIGLPLCAVLLGPKGTLFAVIFDMGIGVSLWTISVMVLQNQVSLTPRTLKPLLNAPLIAIIVGVSCFFLELKMHDSIIQLLQRLGAIAAPLALIYIGFFIPKMLKNRKQINLSLLVLPIGIKLLLMPVITAFILACLNLEREITQVILLMSTMPTGAMVPILFEQFKADHELGASATIYATILSLVTIPMMFYLGSWIIKWL